MSGFLIGTIGHVDHGKTSLINKLTGIETDRLLEEKNRGISIVNGYAYLKYKNNTISIIDMPGHERFIKNMLSGITGVQFILIVIAADESVMAQTKEHLDIARLLGIENGAFVITKTDMVDEDFVELVEMEIDELKENTIFNNFEIFKVSSHTGFGIDKLKDYIFDSFVKYSKTNDYYPRLYIDRIFNQKGIGTIVTGSLQGASLSIKDKLQLYPYDNSYQIRSIQVHSSPVEKAEINSRVALNVQSQKNIDMHRGIVLASQDRYFSSDEMLIKYKVLSEHKDYIRNASIYKFYFGSNEVMGKLYLYSEDKAYIKLDEKVFTFNNQKGILRLLSPVITIAGITIIDSNPLKGRKLKNESLKIYDDLTNFDYICWKNKYGIEKKDLCKELMIKEDEFDININKSLYSLSDKYYFSKNQIPKIKEELLSNLNLLIKDNPLRDYYDKEAFRTRFYNNITRQNFEAILNLKEINDDIIFKRNAISLRNHKVELSKLQKEIYDDIIKTLTQSGLDTKEIVTKYNNDEKYKEVYNYLLHLGEIIKINSEIAASRELIYCIKDFIIGIIEVRGSLSIDDIRNEYSSTRQFAIAYLEYFDTIGLTKRLENDRVLK